MRDDLIEPVPVPVDGAVRCRQVGTRRRRRTYLVSASAIVAVMVLAVVTAAHHPGRLDLGGRADVPDTLAPDPPPVVDDGSPLPLAPAALAARPTIPPGWRTLTLGLAQFAVPGDWIVIEPGDRRDLCGTEAGAALAAQGRPVVSFNGTKVGGLVPDDPGGCRPVPRSLEVFATPGDCPTVNFPCVTGSVNGLRVRRAPDVVTVPELSTALFIAGLDEDTVTAVLATLVPSPVVRVLSAGPLLDTTGWTRSSLNNLQVVTPPRWRTHDLGTTEPVPGACTGGTFEQHPQTLLTGKAVMPACPGDSHSRPSAVRIDGAWLYEMLPVGGIPMDDLPRLGGGREPLRRGVDLVNLDRGDTVAFVVVTSGGNVVVTVGIGADETVARTIIHGITLGGTPIGSLPRG
jgi:hypothetical protein